MVKSITRQENILKSDFILKQNAMYAAQYVQLLRLQYKRLLHLDISRLFLSSSEFQDSFDLFFQDSNNIIQFLFHTSRNTMSKETLYQILEMNKIPIPFSTIYYDLALYTNIIVFIQTLVKMNKENFIYTHLPNALAEYFNCSVAIYQRLIKIVMRCTCIEQFNIDQIRLLQCKRLVSVENILQQYEMEDMSEEFELPESNK